MRPVRSRILAFVLPCPCSKRSICGELEPLTRGAQSRIPDLLLPLPCSKRLGCESQALASPRFVLKPSGLALCHALFKTGSLKLLASSGAIEALA